MRPCDQPQAHDRGWPCVQRVQGRMDGRPWLPGSAEVPAAVPFDGTCRRLIETARRPIRQPNGGGGCPRRRQIICSAWQTRFGEPANAATLRVLRSRIPTTTVGSGRDRLCVCACAQERERMCEGVALSVIGGRPVARLVVVSGRNVAQASNHAPWDHPRVSHALAYSRSGWLISSQLPGVRDMGSHGRDIGSTLGTAIRPGR